MLQTLNDSQTLLCKTLKSAVFKADLFLKQMTFTFSICSFSAANSETEPKTNLNSLRYRLESSTLEPISGRRSRRYSTKMVAKRAEVVGFAKKELATIYKRKPQRTYYCCNKKNKRINALSIKKNPKINFFPHLHYPSGDLSSVENNNICSLILKSQVKF